MPLQVEHRRYPMTRTTVVRPVGELSVASMPLVRTALRRAVREDSAVIVVDLGLALVPDDGIVVPLVEAVRLGRAFGAEVVVATVPERLAARLARSGLVDRRRGRSGHEPAAPEDVDSRAPVARRRGPPGA